MAATKYQVLYRYVNEATNTPIVNSMESDYKAVCELYADPDHKIFSVDKADQDEALAEQQELISYGNSSENPKTNMLFAYDGTKKVKHKKWIEESTGYVVRDWKRIKRSLIGNQGDFTKDFTTIDATTPEDGGTVICNEAVMKKYFPSTVMVVADESQGDLSNSYGKYYSEAHLNDLITEATFWKLNTNSYVEHGEEPVIEKLLTGYSYSRPIYTSHSIGPVSVEQGKVLFTGYQGRTLAAYPSETNTYSNITIKQSQIETTVYPGHYEDSNEAPYLIIDTYKRIQLSPWFVNSTYSSLESALTRVKKLVEMIGMDNVKLIKVVPFDQLVKIK